MRRTIFLPRSLGWSLLLGFVLNAGGQMASAQGLGQLPGFGQQKEFGDAKEPKGVKEVPEPYILILQKDTTRQIEMSTKELISEFRSENPKVVKVQALIDNPRAVLVSGIAPGSTRVYLTDVKKNTESLEVRVPLDEEADREAKRRELLDQVRRAVPTASIDVIPSGSATVILTGNVPHADNVLTITELTRGVFGPAANVVNNMRIGGVQQVQLEVTIARVNRSLARNVGFSWLNGGQNHFVASNVGPAGNLATAFATPSVLNPTAALAATPNAVFSVFNDKQGFIGYLNALKTEGLAKIMSEPRVITLSGRPAYIVSGGETPILTTSGTGSPSVTYKTFGTVVNFLPIVLGNGKIHLEVRPEISSLNAANGISIPGAGGVTTVPGFDVRSAQVAVQIEDGQTLAIGGLIQTTLNAQNAKVPILGEIPILAFAFTSKTYSETEEELIILVTPHLIDPMACNQIPKYLPGRETRSADDFELFLEGILEAPRGQRTIEHPYRAAYLNSASPYPCGDASGLRGARCGPAGCSNAGCSNTGLAPNPGSSGNPPGSAAAASSAMYRNAQPVDTDSDTRPALVTVVGNDTGPDASPAVFTPGVLMQPR